MIILFLVFYKLTLLMVSILFSLFLLLLSIVILYSKRKGQALRKQRAKKDKSLGKRGEKYVAKRLQEIVNRYGGFLYNNFCFRDENGHSSEIDHILINRGGFFVIETKAIQGIIYGNENEALWTCASKRNGKYITHSIKNPVRQNIRHILHLKQMFKSPPKMQSLVIFTFPSIDLSNVDSKMVNNVTDALTCIEERTSKPCRSKKFVKNANREFKKIKKKYSITKEQHIEYIKNFAKH